MLIHHVAISMLKKISNYWYVISNLKANFSKKLAKKIFSLHGGKIQFEFCYIKWNLFYFYFSDKEGKIKYLEKVIDCVSFALGENLTAKPSKIVSGQEPQKTNEFLQALAQIIDKKIGT